MRVRRGMFRLWIVTSVIYVALAGTGIYRTLTSPPTTKAYEFVPPPAEIYPPINPYDNLLQNTHYTVDYPYNVRLYVPVGTDLKTIKDRSEWFVKEYVNPRRDELRAQFRDMLGYSLAALVLPPIGVLLFGAAIAWALDGFRKDPST